MNPFWATTHELRWGEARKSLPDVRHQERAHERESALRLDLANHGPQIVDGEAGRLAAPGIGPVVGAVENEGEGGPAGGERVENPRIAPLRVRGVEAVVDDVSPAEMGGEHPVELARVTLTVAHAHLPVGDAVAESQEDRGAHAGAEGQPYGHVERPGHHFICPQQIEEA